MPRPPGWTLCGRHNGGQPRKQRRATARADCNIPGWVSERPRETGTEMSVLFYATAVKTHFLSVGIAHVRLHPSPLITSDQR